MNELENTIENELVAKLKAGERSAFRQLYQDCYQAASIYIMNKKGTASDVEDTFQEALLVLVKKLRDPSFKLDVKPQTYLKAVLKKMWLYRLRGTKENVEFDQKFDIEIGDDILEKETLEKKHLIAAAAMDDMDEKCKQLLLAYYYKNESLGTIAKKMEYTADFVKIKKGRCMKKLRKLAEQHPEFKNLLK